VRPIVRVILILALLATALAGCRPFDQAEAPGKGWDRLARHVPAESETILFFDLKPGPELAPHWDRIRRRLAETPAGRTLLAQMLAPFKSDLFDIAHALQGPAVSGQDDSASFVIYQVADEAAALETMLDSQGDASAWNRKTYQGKLLYHGRIGQSPGDSLYVAWTIEDSLLFLISDRSFGVTAELERLLDLIQAGSLEALPAWLRLRDELPDPLLGLVFMPMPESTRRRVDDGTTSQATSLDEQVGALALALLPQAQGLRVELYAPFRTGIGSMPEYRNLLDLPPVASQAWAGLPADTVLALSSHDAHTLWPWAQALVSIGVLPSLVPRINGLDLEADLLTADGPLSGAFTLAVSPPLPDQSLVDNLPALQLLLVAPDASPAQAEGLHAAMEARGTVFGSDRVEGVDIQKQVGTAATGYALAYGFDGGRFHLGSSPQILAAAFAARRDGDGLADWAAFPAVAQDLPADPALAIFLNVPALFELARANLPGDEFQADEAYQILSTFEAIGLGLRLRPDQADGVLYLYMPD
jgi:hypothetical protein